MIIARLLRFLFHLLYHPFAFMYDMIAWIVSLGRWNDWVKAVVPFVQGRRVLELCPGPGHLQRFFRDHGLASLGLEESVPMIRLANKQLISNGYTQTNLIRGKSQNLPFPNELFDTIVSTFPSEYIFDQRTLAEVRRCLSNGGRLVVLPVAWHIGRRMIERFMAFVFRVTGESPRLEAVVLERLRVPFDKAGFQVVVHKIEERSSLLLIILANKSR